MFARAKNDLMTIKKDTDICLFYLVVSTFL
jgi:hypothetical protein